MQKMLQKLADKALELLVPRVTAQAACINGYWQCCNTTCTVHRWVCYNTVTERWYYGSCVHS